MQAPWPCCVSLGLTRPGFSYFLRSEELLLLKDDDCRNNYRVATAVNTASHTDPNNNLTLSGAWMQSLWKTCWQRSVLARPATSCGSLFLPWA